MSVIEKKPGKQTRNPGRSKSRILKAARKEFARHGFSGGRVDSIAARANINKRMLYHYFGSKEQLYIAALEDVYSDIRLNEQEISIEGADPIEALSHLVDHNWNYYLENPDFLKLVNQENLLEARYLRKSGKLADFQAGYIDMIERILARGRARGVFHRDVGATQVSLTISALTFYFLNNAHTNSVLFGMDLLAEEALAGSKAQIKKILLASLKAGS